MIQDTLNQDRRLEETSGQNKIYLWLLIFLAVASILFLLFKESNSPVSSLESANYGGSVSLTSMAASEETMESSVEKLKLQGQLVFKDTPTIYSPEKGYIRYEVDEGEEVNQGTVIASINNPDLLNELEQEVTKLENTRFSSQRQEIKIQREKNDSLRALELAKMEMKSFEYELKRAERGLKEGIVTALEYDQAKYNLHIAEVKLKYAEQDYKLLQKNLTFEKDILSQELALQELRVEKVKKRVEALSLTSPIDGVIGNLLTSQDSVVGNAQPLMTVVNSKSMAVEARIPESYASLISKESPVKVNVLSSVFEANIESISPQITNGKFNIRASFANNLSTVLKQNQSVTVDILLDRSGLHTSQSAALIASIY